MLPKKHRLSLSSYKHFSKRTKRLFSPEFQITAAQNDSILKVAIVVSKKVAKKAVDRNHIKRLISESLRKNIANIKFSGNVAIFVKKNISDLTQTQVEGLILKIFKKL